MVGKYGKGCQGRNDSLTQCRKRFPKKNHEKGSAELITKTQKFAPQYCSVGKIAIEQAALASVAEQVNEVTEQVTEQVTRLLNCLQEGPLGTWRLMHQLQLQHRPTFLYDYLQPALAAKLVAMTRPDSPKSPTQKYRLTDKGRQLRERLSLEIV
jgi:hypothetical protein